MTTLTYCGWLLASYVVGSVPFGLLLGFAKGVDIRAHGSGNVGATNAGRLLGRKIGLLCFGLDVLKGFGPVLAFGLVSGTGRVLADPSTAAGNPTFGALAWLAIAAAAVVGHVFPVWLRFRGGKGVATSLGVLLGVFPYLAVPALLGFVAWYVTVRVSGYVGLASVVAAACLPVLTVGSGLAFDLGAGPTAVFAGVTALLAALVVQRHRGNLRRILDGVEPKAGWTQSRGLERGGEGEGRRD